MHPLSFAFHGELTKDEGEVPVGTSAPSELNAPVRESIAKADMLFPNALAVYAKRPERSIAMYEGFNPQGTSGKALVSDPSKPLTVKLESVLVSGFAEYANFPVGSNTKTIGLVPVFPVGNESPLNVK